MKNKHKVKPKNWREEIKKLEEKHFKIEKNTPIWNGRVGLKDQGGGYFAYVLYRKELLNIVSKQIKKAKQEGYGEALKEARKMVKNTKIRAVGVHTKQHTILFNVAKEGMLDLLDKLKPKQEGSD